MSLQIDQDKRSVSNGSFTVKKSGVGNNVYDVKCEKKVLVPAPMLPAPVVLAAPVVS